MATGIKEMRDKLMMLLRDFGSLIIKSFKETEADAIDLNVSQMREHGIKSDGSDIGEYSPYTKQLRDLEGKQTEFMDLHDTGDFHSGMRFKTITKEYALIESTDSKDSMLSERYGDEIKGLTDENMDEYKLQFVNELLQLMKKRL